MRKIIHAFLLIFDKLDKLWDQRKCTKWLLRVNHKSTDQTRSRIEHLFFYRIVPGLKIKFSLLSIGILENQSSLGLDVLRSLNHPTSISLTIINKGQERRIFLK